ncbi:MAG: hypothetical protein KatS3mg130_1526 [Candidatus Sumerlaea sp.]|uniref:Putative conserved integral membrane protein n=1 Tax=Sumerlaea chitinivorans TaxID=2250252 RepID=A0A2Z4Y578_SUMC1|nr:putative conserved integral membrane protein [Candidatus Sumerlaea chitinivorans]GIX45118.1 MAG: hypothetical protein KatS3mg130_1526 [Candidatus Sumerlaea sp.]
MLQQETPQAPTVTPRYLYVALWALSVAYFAYYYVYKPFSMHGVDFTVLWRAAENFVHGRSVYAEPPILVGADGWEVFKYPQFSALLFSWLAFLPFEIAEWCWKGLLLAAVVVSTWVTYRWVSEADNEVTSLAAPKPLLDRRLLLPLVALSISMFSPLSWALQLGQVGPLLALLLLLHFWLLHRKHELLAGSVWALSVLVKVVPIAMVVYYVAFRRWRFLLGALGTGAFYLLALLVLGRLHDEWDYVVRVAPDIAALTKHVSRSLSHFGELVASGMFPTESAWMQRIERGIIGGAALLYVLSAAWLAYRRVNQEAALASAVVGLIVISPVVEGHHFVVLLPALAVQARMWLLGQIQPTQGLIIVLAWLPIFVATLFHQYTTALFQQFIPTLSSFVLWLSSIWAAFSTSGRRTQ